MPHKRNPVKCEQLCGLARVLRGNLQAGLENVALWHERDISHSSVERIILPDSLHARLLRAGEVPRRSSRACVVLSRADAARTSTRRYGLVFSQPVLLALVEPGLTRDDAYRIVQRDAMAHVGGAPAVPRRAARGPRGHRARSTRRAARRVLRPRPRALANVGRAVDALDALEPLEPAAA